ncbi:MAG: type II toxin-antitoxin system RelE/ParE family toxin [Holosporales bacterium]|jgi:mRNA-degrading endonuclease RelE of RelBE toxin-antitoxin system|nr:type II toxin-antitoxin system RelE/ParE family toxin [Holosporales bacterium]
MSYKLSISPDADDFLFALQGKQFKQIVKAVFMLMDDPYPQDTQELKGYPGFRRKDVGEYRLIYGIQGDTVSIDVIDKRNDDTVYRRFSRKH